MNVFEKELNTLFQHDGYAALALLKRMPFSKVLQYVRSLGYVPILEYIPQKNKPQRLLYSNTLNNPALFQPNEISNLQNIYKKENGYTFTVVTVNSLSNNSIDITRDAVLREIVALYNLKNKPNVYTGLGWTNLMNALLPSTPEKRIHFYRKVFENTGIWSDALDVARIHSLKSVIVFLINHPKFDNYIRELPYGRTNNVFKTLINLKNESIINALIVKQRNMVEKYKNNAMVQKRLKERDSVINNALRTLPQNLINTIKFKT